MSQAAEAMMPLKFILVILQFLMMIILVSSRVSDQLIMFDMFQSIGWVLFRWAPKENNHRQSTLLIGK